MDYGTTIEGAQATDGSDRKNKITLGSEEYVFTLAGSSPTPGSTVAIGASLQESAITQTIARAQTISSTPITTDIIIYVLWTP